MKRTLSGRYRCTLRTIAWWTLFAVIVWVFCYPLQDQMINLSRWVVEVLAG